MNKLLEVIPLGGIGEFGMNCMAIRYADEMIIVDAGMGFPEESAYGVDVSIPDFDFLNQYREYLTAIILTHGHEDHIGGLPYLLKKFNLPVYASHLTASLCESKLEEHKILGDVLIHRVGPREVADLGFFQIEFVRATHSLVDCFSIAITTPAGTLIHTGDYKMDETPVLGERMDLETLRRYGQSGVLALFSDSTNASIPGRTPSEQAVIPGFQEIFAEAPGRVIVAAFSSSIHRIQIILDVAEQFGRKVCVLGRSMQRNFEIAERLGYLAPDRGLLIGVNEAGKLPRDEVALLVTGTQGEPRAVLPQMASQSYKGLSVEDDDTVVLSARIIPGNERAISRLEGDIYKRGANIIDEKRRLVHVSGHASQEDIRMMTEAVRPQFVIPIHGEYRMLYRHREFLRNHVGYKHEKILLIENGDVLELGSNHAFIASKREIGRIFIDESGFEEIGRETMRERKQLAGDGVITPVATINEDTGKLSATPEIISRGVIGLDGSPDGFLKAMQSMVAEAIENASSNELRDQSLLKERIRLELKRFIQKETGGRPVIIPVIVQTGADEH